MVTHAYDNADHRTSLTLPNTNSVAYAYDAAYDLNGNLATVTDAGVTTTYTWNARNQLTGISTTGFAASFTYDSFGRRTGRTVQGVVNNYVYDGLNPVQEKAGVTVTANLLTGLGIDEFFTRTDGVGVRALIPDALGSTVALGDATVTCPTRTALRICAGGLVMDISPDTRMLISRTTRTWRSHCRDLCGNLFRCEGAKLLAARRSFRIIRPSR
jgi:YD repeat-containing protein